MPFFSTALQCQWGKGTVNHGTLPHYLLPLDWLAERDVKTEDTRNSNYALCLTITEKPASLWLVYDCSELEQ